MKVILHATIAKIEEKFNEYAVRKLGGKYTFTQKSRGWFVHLEGSSGSIKLFETREEWEGEWAPGDKVKITFEREP